MKFYGLGYSQKENKSYRINLDSTSKHLAVYEAYENCQKNGLLYQGVRFDPSTQRGAGTMAKRFADGSLTPSKKGRSKR